MFRIFILIVSFALISGKTVQAQETIRCPSVETCLKLAEDGDAQVQYELGVMLLKTKNGVKKNKKKLLTGTKSC